MIALGLTALDKATEIARYVASHDIERIYVISPIKYAIRLDLKHEAIAYDDVIMYKFYYRLLQEIDHRTLIVVNECLRTQNRADLTYNCIRNFLQQTSHQIIFQYLPIIDTLDDFMILFDFATRSRWRRESWRHEFVRETQITVRPVSLELQAVHIQTDDRVKSAYIKEKRKLIDGIGLKDPHTIPRNLHLMAGPAKLTAIDPSRRYIGRNNRYKIPTLEAYKEDAYASPPYTVFEFCHNFIDFSDFLALSRQTEIPVLVSDLKVDHWYLERYQAWIGRIRDAYAAIHG